MKLRNGLYDTVYGNTALYKGGKTAKDLDMGERVPVELLEVSTWRPEGVKVAPNGARVIA
jgi:hypothetical protein